MRKNYVFLLAVLGLGIVFSLVTGCKVEDTMTKNDRLDAFIADVNSASTPADWNALIDHTYSGADFSDFTGENWKTNLEADRKWSVDSYGNPAVIKSEDGFTTYNVTFIEESSDNWVILKVGTFFH